MRETRQKYLLCGVCSASTRGLCASGSSLFETISKELPSRVYCIWVHDAGWNAPLEDEVEMTLSRAPMGTDQCTREASQGECN